MPELGPNAYRLPQIRYEAPRTPTFEATQIVPDLRGAAALKGSAASMNLVAETIAKLPDIITKSLGAGRKEAQQKAVHGIKMDALGGGKSPAELRALQGFTFGEDDSLSYKPQDPALAALDYDEKKASAEYRRALAAKALKGDPSLYDTIGGAGGTPALPTDPNAPTPEGDVLPPLDPATAGAPAPVAVGSVSSANRGALADGPPLASEPALGAEAPVAPPATPALAAPRTGPATGPITAADLPLPAADAPTAPVSAAATPAAPAKKRGLVRATNANEPHEFYDEEGNLTHVLLPGANTWQKHKEEDDKGLVFPTKEAAEEAGWDTSGAKVNTDGSITVKKIPIAKEQRVPADMRKIAMDLGIKTTGKDPGVVEEEINNYRKANNLMTPEQIKNANALQGRLSSDKAYTDILSVKQAYTAMQGSQKQDSAIGDVALINSFQRIIDPGVSVREGDVALIQKSAGIFEQLKNLPEVWSGNARIPDKMREQMIQLSASIYKSKVENFYASKGKSIVEQAKRYNVPTDILGLDFGIPIEGVEIPGAAPAKPAAEPNGKPATGGYLVGKKYQGKTYLGGDPTDTENWK